MHAIPFEDSKFLFEHQPGAYIHPDRVTEWIADLPAHVGLSLMTCRRLIPRLSLRISNCYGLPPLDDVPIEDLRIAMLSRDRFQEISLVAGAVYNGQSLRVCITGNAIAEALSDINSRAYNISVTHADLAPPTTKAASAPIAPPPKETIEQDGKLCFQSWLDTLPTSVSSRAYLKLPLQKTSAPLSDNFRHYGPGIVRAVAKELFFNDSE